MAGHYATTSLKSAPLYSDFAREFLTKKFSPAVVEAVYAAVPKYTKGPRKGLTKGYVHWIKCVRGGWYRTGNSYEGRSRGFVLRPGTHCVTVRVSNDPYSLAIVDSEANADDAMRIEYINTHAAEFFSKRKG